MALPLTQSPTRVVLIACGSFNPVTNMHLRMFELARDSLNKTGRYQVVGGIMSPVSDFYSKKGLEKATHRCEMVQLALESMDWVRLDTWESEQDKWTETLHVLEHHSSKLRTVDSNANISLKNVSKDEVDGTRMTLQNLCFNQPTAQIKLLCGADLLESFAKPGLWKDEDLEKILSKYGLVCITRENSDPRKFIYENDMLNKYQENIFIVPEWIRNDISSTKIRRALRRGESVKFLLQEPVIDYIYQHQLYNINTFKSNKNLNEIVNLMYCHTSKNVIEEKGMSLQSSTFSSAEFSSHSPKRQREFDETDYIQYSPKRRTCMGDIGGLMRKVKSARMAFTPETCV
ncbi:nicotinamide/nicotinic acid mononucleotide adenylyltransferase 1-like [Octopus sinensis]|uniref:Nicotinamide-nucleotide adenylyltransferase n=1 Tax=Octopus sinensis TaxID=2607531 RepID=A0A6P7TZ25_9MOLL|nr:nicotinamide/nicotinic acid mononucleotide adenylyltransferase 1-like [Octopus sinensis]